MDVTSLAFAALLRTDPRRRGSRALTHAWSRCWSACEARWRDRQVRTKLHGQTALINFANPYPFTVRYYPNHNAPQVEAVLATAEAKRRPVCVVDVGAAVGDSALLLMERCRSQMSRLHLIEGEPAFTKLLRANMQDERVQIHQVVVADRVGTVPGLTRIHHQGTAAAAGPERMATTTLDELLKDEMPDVIKIDTDGYDGLVLSGGFKLLVRARPTVLFEWAPRSCRDVGSDPARAFTILREAGYDRFVFFTKFGQFSHFGSEHLDELARLCLDSSTLDDWHYDVLALHASSGIDPVSVADLRHWGRAGW